ncbi:HlyD family type I secretion periplasmic adaptor subunit [uncultured Propionivibrio sp.]|uniref:HlyD family type I secretion periplasmic adaptor subunit n=1 Tax=uncultured Propionivibrio sp. TaxID=426737 RepID=UPI0029C0F803|nr:HlyD family type I secretion periplasmic adaptor subunit [uncultured Propionivibrio sp.]
MTDWRRLLARDGVPGKWIAGGVTRVYERFVVWGPARSFVVITGSFFLLILLWASVVQIDVIVRAEGRVIPAGRAQIIQHLEGGIVKAVYVREGQGVQRNQLLMELADIKARSDLGQEKTRLMALRGREARLIAESEGRDHIEFPAGLDDAEVRQTEKTAFRARQERKKQEAAVLREQSQQKRTEIREAENRSDNLRAELDVARKQAAVIEGLRRNGAASQLELLDAQGRMQRLMSQLGDTQASLPRLRSAVAETESRIAEQEAKFRAEASAELTQIRADLEKSQYEFVAGEDRLVRNQVRAPVSGYVNRVAVTTVGGVVKPGEVLLEITPDDGEVIVEGRIRPNDRANLHSGQPARVRLGAFDYATFGMLAGRVEEVSADTLSDEKGERYYRVRIIAAPAANQRLAPLPGMTAEADVVVGQRTVISYLLSPILRFADTAFRDPR